MAQVATMHMNEALSPQLQAVNPQSSTGELLPSLPSSAGPGPDGAGSAAARLSGQVQVVASAKERASSAGSVSSSRRQSGALTSIPLQPAPPSYSDGPTGAQAIAKLPPLMHGYGTNASGGGFLRTTPISAGSMTLQQQQFHMEPLQPVSQHAAMLSGPVPAAHPYQPKRKPPSAFMRNNPTRQQLEANSQSTYRGGSAGSHRSYAAAYDTLYAMPADTGARAGSDTGLPVDRAQQQQLQVLQQQQQQQSQFADEVIAAAQAAILQGHQQQLQQPGLGGQEGGGNFSAVPPWGVSSVSDLEALDSILDQLVVVDARMRKALLKGPLISFETVVPEHIMNAARGYQPQQQPYMRGGEEEKDRTFITAVKGMAAEDGGEDVEAAAGAEVVEAQAAAGAPPPSPAPREGDIAAALAQQHATTRQTRSADEAMDGRDSSLFPASIPNPGMHPTFTRAYLTSKLTSKPQHLPPPPPATAEHLLRSRPPPFIAAPSYDQLCSQIRDVQRQYTCGTTRPAAAGTSVAGPAVATIPPSNSTNQYIAGLDGPTLEEVVAHQELPISLERVRPTFVALKQKAARGPSPRRRPGSPGRAQVPPAAAPPEAPA